MNIDKGNIDSYVNKLEKDFGLYARQMLKFEPSPKQMKIVHKFETEEHVQGIFNRQGGKSTIMGAYDAWKLPFGDDDDIIYLFAPILDQTNIIAGKLRQFIKSNDLIMSFMDEFSKHHITTIGGAQFHAHSASEQSHIRGHSPTIIQIDESQDIADFKYYEDILPSGSSTGAKIQEIGTTRGRNHFYRNSQNPKIVKVYQHWKECPFTSEKYILRMMKITPKHKFEMEYCNKFDVDYGMAFPFDLLSLAFSIEPDLQNEPDPQGEFFAGLDFGKHEDPTVCAIIQRKMQDNGWHYYQVDREEWIGSDYDEIMADVGDDYFDKYKPENALGDKTGVGEGVIDMFPDAYGLDAQDLTNDDKEYLADMMNILLEQQRVHLWDEWRQREELEHWQRDKLPGGSYRYHHPTGEHDDMVIAILLALKAAEDGPAKVNYKATGETKIGTISGQRNSMFEERRPLDILRR